MIGREKEIKLLEDTCNSNKSELISIYGRRRIGKTFLVNHMFNEHKKDCLFFRFTGSYTLSSSEQRENFIEAIYDWFSEEPTKVIENWMTAFNFLKRVINKKEVEGKIVIFIDEIPWIDKKNNDGFIGALGHFWNDYCENKRNIILILCGSNSSWIKNKIFEDSSGPLYQRLTNKISLKPFTLKETYEYLTTEKKYIIDSKTATEIYMIFGGVAKYLSYINESGDINNDIDNLFFSVDGHLHKEYTSIFKSLFFEKSQFYTQIVDFLCTKGSGYSLSEICEKLNIKPGRKLTEALEDLEECGFILGLSKYGAKRSVKYIVADQFVLFYNKWVKNYNNNEIINLKFPHWINQVNTQQYNVWAGFAFESVCLTNIDLYLDARKTKGLSKSYSYWNYLSSGENDKGAQIDILIEYENNTYEIVECKYYNDEFIITKDYKANILNKIEKFKNHGVSGKYTIIFAMLTTYGCKNNEHYKNLPIIANIKLDDLFK